MHWTWWLTVGQKLYPSLLPVYYVTTWVTRLHTSISEYVGSRDAASGQLTGRSTNNLQSEGLRRVLVKMALNCSRMTKDLSWSFNLSMAFANQPLTAVGSSDHRKTNALELSFNSWIYKVYICDQGFGEWPNLCHFGFIRYLCRLLRVLHLRGSCRNTNWVYPEATRKPWDCRF